MKVLCVDLSNPERPDILKPEDYISVGMVYTVTSTLEYEGRTYYCLAEKPHLPERWRLYNVRRFIPVESLLNIEKVKKKDEQESTTPIEEMVI